MQAGIAKERGFVKRRPCAYTLAYPMLTHCASEGTPPSSSVSR